MSDFFSDQSITIECPQCNKQINRTVRQLKRDGNTCPRCGVAFDSKQFRDEIDKAERAIRNFLK